jgi:biotin operon repressor
MSILKYFSRVERMHRLIKNASTGSCEEFANKMGLSRRQLLENISELKEMGGPITFSAVKNSYHYDFDWDPFSSRLQKSDLRKFIGGNFIRCNPTAPQLCIIDLSIHSFHSYLMIADTEKLIE